MFKLVSRCALSRCINSSGTQRRPVLAVGVLNTVPTSAAHQQSSSGNDLSWNTAITEAERVANYPTSFISLRFLLKDEISNLAVYLRRVLQTKHPMISTAKNLLKNQQYTRGLIALLVAKSIGVNRSSLEDNPTEDLITSSQIVSSKWRTLAELLDMIHVAHLLHRNVLDMDASSLTKSQFDDLHFGNKLSILVGDYLLAQASRNLAFLKRPKVVGLVAQGIMDFTVGEFAQEAIENRLKECSNKILVDDEFLEKMISDVDSQLANSGGSLLANGCRSVALIGGHGEEMMDLAHRIGNHIGIILQAYETLRENNLNFSEAYLNIVRNRVSHHVKSAILLIGQLGESEATTSLVNILTMLPNYHETQTASSYNIINLLSNTFT